MKVILSNFFSVPKSERTLDKVKDGKKKTEILDIFHAEFAFSLETGWFLLFSSTTLK